MTKVERIEAELEAMVNEPVETPSFGSWFGGGWMVNEVMKDIRFQNKLREYQEAVKEEQNYSLPQSNISRIISEG